MGGSYVNKQTIYMAPKSTNESTAHYALQPARGLFSRTSWVVQHQKGFNEARDNRVAVALEYLLLLLHPFNGLFSRTTSVSWHQKSEPFWILLEQEMTGVTEASAGSYVNHLHLIPDR